jgi:hypothetical protein
MTNKDHRTPLDSLCAVGRDLVSVGAMSKKKLKKIEAICKKAKKRDRDADTGKKRGKTRR